MLLHCSFWCFIYQRLTQQSAGPFEFVCYCRQMNLFQKAVKPLSFSFSSNPTWSLCSVLFKEKEKNMGVILLLCELELVNHDFHFLLCVTLCFSPTVHLQHASKVPGQQPTRSQQPPTSALDATGLIFLQHRRLWSHIRSLLLRSFLTPTPQTLTVSLHFNQTWLLLLG